MSSETLIIYGLAIVVVAAIVVPYLFRFRRRIEGDRARKSEAMRLGIDKPSAQYPYVNALSCVGCGACVDACPEGDVLGVVWGTAVVINGMRCVGHGLCEDACPVGAIEVGLGDLRSRSDVPVLDEHYRTNVDGLLVVGELGGLSLVRNAVSQGREAVVQIAAELQGAERGSGGPGDVFDLAVIGAGPAGLSAALTAAEKGLSYVVFEREDDLGGSLLHYPRRKMVLTQPVEIPPWGSLAREEYRKEELLGIFEDLVREFELNIRFGEPVEALTRESGRFRIRSVAVEAFARRVVLAQGRRGLPRKLGVPGEELPKVMYRLLDAASYKGKQILVVGGGDSAVEAAIGLARDSTNRVALSYRREKLVRIKKKNQDAFDRAENTGVLEAAFGSQVVEIRENQVRLRLADGSIDERENDYVFVFAGGVPPFDLLKSAGVRFGGP